MKVSHLDALLAAFWVWVLLFAVVESFEMLSSSARHQIISSSKSSVQRIRESVWRRAAFDHQNRIYELLKPGLTDSSHVLNSGISRQHKEKLRDGQLLWTALDPEHPVFNFLIEYYGLKGAKGVKRLARWSPKPHDTGVLLEGATEKDVGNNLLHLRGAVMHSNGIEYNPSRFFENDDDSAALERTARPFLWFRSVLQNTAQAEPVLHCYGLHEWAMQYQPKGAPPPPAAQYQSHLPLRVDRSIINEAVERKGVRCTHIDALRFFAPAALPLNKHKEYNRNDQLRLEQPACVHANMDLLKYTLRLSPFVDATLVQRVLELALRARMLDVAASPYDCEKAYGVEAVPIETAPGRAEYRRRQMAMMQEAAPVRRDLLLAYNEFLGMAFPSLV